MNVINEETPESYECISANSVFRSGVNKGEKDSPVRQQESASKGYNSAMKRRGVVSEVVGLKKIAW